MRIRLIREGVATVDGRLIDKDALTWHPIIPVQNTEQQVVANVHHIRREAMGWITGEINVTRRELRGFAAQADLDDIESTTDGETMVISRGRLKGIVLGKTPTWPGMVVS